jgi:Carboxypeptidase regulatory-like domain
MPNRSEKLNALVIGFECRTSWDEMTGDGPRRFCAECRREVLDLERLTPEQIRGHLQASRGKLCGRLTRRDGRLAMAREMEPLESARPWAPRRASAIAAGLVAAWLTASHAEARISETAATAAGSGEGAAKREPVPARRATSTPRAALRGRVTANGRPVADVAVVARNVLDGRESTASTGSDGTFTMSALPSGIYDVEGSREGFSIGAHRAIVLQAGEQRRVDLTAEANAETVLLGAVVVEPDPLRKVYDESDLVIAAVVGPSVVVQRDGRQADVVTDLRIESSIKGTVPGRDVAYRHDEYAADDATGGSWRADFVPGTRMLAFLQRSKADVALAGRPAFESVDYHFGIRRLGDPERAAYLARLDALARIDREARRRGEMSPGDLAEWIVATAENPLTRGEATAELRQALEALAENATKAGISAEVAAEDLKIVVDRFHAEGGALRGDPPAALLGAHLTAAQRARLTAALGSTETTSKGDRELFSIVRAWDEKAATEWLVRRLRAADPKSGDSGDLWWLFGVAEELNDDPLRDAAAAAAEREQEMQARWAGDASPETEKLRQEELAALVQDLRRQFVALLSSTSRGRREG